MKMKYLWQFSQGLNLSEFVRSSKFTISKLIETEFWARQLDEKPPIFEQNTFTAIDYVEILLHSHVISHTFCVYFALESPKLPNFHYTKLAINFCKVLWIPLYATPTYTFSCWRIYSNALGNTHLRMKRYTNLEVIKSVLRPSTWKRVASNASLLRPSVRTLIIRRLVFVPISLWKSVRTNSITG